MTVEECVVLALSLGEELSRGMPISNTVTCYGIMTSTLACVPIFSADTRLDERRDALCIVNYTGDIQWVPQGIYMSTCDVDVYSFPFDKQVCSLKFGSWAYDGTKLDLTFHMEEKMLTEDYFVPNKAWTVLDTPGVRNVLSYACCLETYIDLTYTVVFRRTATFYTYILILPCVLLTSLTLVLFWIPPESPTKMALGELNSIYVYSLIQKQMNRVHVH